MDLDQFQQRVLLRMRADSDLIIVPLNIDNQGALYNFSPASEMKITSENYHFGSINMSLSESVSFF